MNSTARTVAVLTAVLLVVPDVRASATLRALTHQPPEAVGLPLLLTDGSIMFQGANAARDWWKLTPDASGSYLDGIWTQLASFPVSWNYAPYAFASAVLADGRVLVEGGEYNPPEGPFPLTNKGAIYDPWADSWTQVAPPPGWDFIGDSASIVMPNGKFLLGNKLDTRITELDPATMTWTALGSTGKTGFNAEEGWTLLPDGTFLAVDVFNGPNTEQYFYTDSPGAGSWSSLGPTPASLVWNYGLAPVAYPGGEYLPPGETGQCMLRPDRTVFCTGASDDTSVHAAHTAIYSLDTGRWTRGPDFPPGDDAEDTSATLMPNGDVLVASYVGALYDFDGTTLARVAPAGGLLITLPTGQALLSGGTVDIYTPDANDAADPSWAPAITRSPQTIVPGSRYAISGTQFNGMSQAQAFGDELQAPTNYPLVRIVNRLSHHVAYARTHDHSTMGIATGDLEVSTTFDVPAGIEPGPAELFVVANGIASAPAAVSVVPGHSGHARPPPPLDRGAQIQLRESSSARAPTPTSPQALPKAAQFP